MRRQISVRTIIAWVLTLWQNAATKQISRNLPYMRPSAFTRNMQEP